MVVFLCRNLEFPPLSSPPVFNRFPTRGGDSRIWVDDTSYTYVPVHLSAERMTSYLIEKKLLIINLKGLQSDFELIKTLSLKHAELLEAD